METIVRSKTQEVISPDQPTRIIGERINPTGKPKLAESLASKDMSRVLSLATSQIESGAAILDVNVGAAGVNEVELLPLAVRAVGEITDLPLCLDSANPNALRAALQVYEGKALINSVNGEERSLEQVLPLVKEFGAAVIGLAMDDNGIPCDPAARLAVAKKIVQRAESYGIPREDVMIDCLALSVCDSTAARSLGSHSHGAKSWGQHDLGANISFGLPDREAINDIFGHDHRRGVNAPIVNPEIRAKAVLISDVLLGRDEFAMNYMTYTARRNKRSSGRRCVAVTQAPHVLWGLFERPCQSAPLGSAGGLTRCTYNTVSHKPDTTLRPGQALAAPENTAWQSLLALIRRHLHRRSAGGIRDGADCR